MGNSLSLTPKTTTPHRHRITNLVDDTQASSTTIANTVSSNDVEDKWLGECTITMFLQILNGRH